jgi:predicted CoA-binding protein
MAQAVGTVAAWNVDRLKPAARRALPLDAEGVLMQPIKEAATEFLAIKRVAVTGVSREPASHGSNVVYKRLKERGYEVFAVNPNTDQVEGDQAFPSLRSIPGGVEAVVIGTRPDRDQDTVRECEELGIKHIWMHRSFGGGSVSKEAAEYGRQHGMTVIDGGCPLMFEPVSDPGHRMMRMMFTINGHVPRQV